MLLIGGTSEIGLAIVRRLAVDAPLAPYLLGRDRERLGAALEAVADATVKALDGSAHTVWVPGILRYVFMILRHLPRALFRRLAL
ncbi:MAG: hypothetical protein ACLP8S_26490 [Solirubrobacteraceae bacterium]